MSRIDWDDLWRHHFGDVESIQCPCCNNALIFRDKNSRSWERGHIIPASKHGPDIYENVRPICLACNNNDKKYESNFHYMVYLGRMTKDDADRSVKEIWMAFDYQRQNFHMVLCLGTLKPKDKGQKGKPCDKKRKPNSLFCGIHGKGSVDHHVRQYYGRMLEKNLELLWQAYYDAAGDPELSQMLADDIEQLSELLG